MAVKLFYPLGKCEEQVVASPEESYLFATLLLNDMKELIQEQPELFLKFSENDPLIEYPKLKDDYFHYIRTNSSPNGIIKKIGFRLENVGDVIMVDICEYRFAMDQILSKLMGRIYYQPQTSEMKISAVRYFSTNTSGTCLAWKPEANIMKDYKAYFMF